MPVVPSRGFNKLTCMPPASPDPLGQIQDQMETLPRALRQVGRVVIDDAQWLLRANVEEIAQRAKVSPPTIIRFCRYLGYDGLRDFKLVLAQRLALGAPHLSHEVGSKSDGHSLLQKLVADTAQRLAEWVSQFDASPLERAIDALSMAQRIDCYGVGNTSMFLANDAQARLFRYGKHSHAYFDPHMQLYSAATLRPADVVLAISHVGRQASLLEAVDMAKKGGAVIVGITQLGTPLAQHADIVLPIVGPQDVSVRMGLESNTAQLLLLETLVVGVGQKLGLPTMVQPERFRELIEKRPQD